MEQIDEKESLLLNIFENQLSIVHEILSFEIEERMHYTHDDFQSKEFCVPLPGLVVIMTNIDDLNEILSKQFICNLFIGTKIKQFLKFTDVLKINTSIKELNLEYNEIGDEGAIAIADVLKINTSIKKINFIDNKKKKKKGLYPLIDSFFSEFNH